MSVEPLAATAMQPVPQPVPPRPDGEDRWPLGSWSLNEFIRIALVPFGLVLLANYLVFGFLGWDSDGGAVLVTVIQQLSLFVPIVVFVRRTRGSLAPLGLRRGGWRARDIFAGIGAGIGAVLAGTVAIAITVEVVRAITGHQPTTTTSLRDLAGPWLLIDAAMAVCLAPICEEVYFRGFVFQGLRGRMRFVWAAVLSGGFFAFVHVEPIRFFGLALMGVILAAVFEHRRTLVASMAAHATINVIAILALSATR
jgi:membrane protease YdiL (CAAX protease family)